MVLLNNQFIMQTPWIIGLIIICGKFEDKAVYVSPYLFVKKKKKMSKE